LLLFGFPHYTAFQIHPYFLFYKTLTDFRMHFILILASLIISMMAAPILHSPLNTQLKSSSGFKKRAGSVSSRSSSSSGGSEHTLRRKGMYLPMHATSATKRSSSSSLAELAPVLKLKDKGNQGQKIKRVRSDEYKRKNSEARKNVYAIKWKKLKGNPVAMAAEKEKRRENAARYYMKKKQMRLEANPDEKETERKKVAKKNARAKTKRLAEFEANPAAKSAWILKNRASVKRSMENKKTEKKEVAEILLNVRGRKSVQLVDEDEKKEVKR
jgi:hypothetical protein